MPSGIEVQERRPPHRIQRTTLQAITLRTMHTTVRRWQGDESLSRHVIEIFASKPWNRLRAVTGHASKAGLRRSHRRHYSVPGSQPAAGWQCPLPHGLERHRDALFGAYFKRPVGLRRKKGPEEPSSRSIPSRRGPKNNRSGDDTPDRLPHKRITSVPQLLQLSRQLRRQHRHGTLLGADIGGGLDRKGMRLGDALALQD